jgi:hypothetical protein
MGLGLHHEDAEAITAKNANDYGGKGKRGQSPGFAMDISFDRLVSSRVGKPLCPHKLVSMQVGDTSDSLITIPR